MAAIARVRCSPAERALGLSRGLPKSVSTASSTNSSCQLALEGCVQLQVPRTQVTVLSAAATTSLKWLTSPQPLPEPQVPGSPFSHTARALGPSCRLPCACWGQAGHASHQSLFLGHPSAVILAVPHPTVSGSHQAGVRGSVAPLGSPPPLGGQGWVPPYTDSTCCTGNGCLLEDGPSPGMAGDTHSSPRNGRGYPLLPEDTCP